LYTLLTGLGEQDPLKRGTMKDPRASSLASAISRMSLSSNATADSKHSRLPDMVMGTRSAADNKAFYNAVEGVVTEKLTALVQIPAEQIMADKTYRHWHGFHASGDDSAGSDSWNGCASGRLHGNDDHGR